MQWISEGPEIPESVGGLDMFCYSNSCVLALPASFFRQNTN